MFPSFFLFAFCTGRNYPYHPMTKELKGKKALITGGSRGIGKAIALKLGRLGADVIINYARNEDAANLTASDLRELGVRAEIFQANVGDPKALDDLAAFTESTFHGVDILIHNAALGAFKPVHKLRLNQWDLSLDVNAKALYLLSQKLLPSFEKRG